MTDMVTLLLVENKKLEKRIEELEDELQVAVAVHKSLEERIAFMEASAAPEKTIDILIK